MLVITVMLVRLKRPMWYTLAPLCFLLVMTILALLLQLRTFWNQGNMFLLVLDIVVMVAMECAAALKRSRSEVAEQQP